MRGFLDRDLPGSIRRNDVRLAGSADWAKEVGCDFPGLGPHSCRRANIAWRQEVGGSAIEASKIAGHSEVDMTGEYTFVGCFYATSDLQST